MAESTDDMFSLTFPLWFPIHQKVLSEGIIKSTSEFGDVGTPVFLQKKLAEDFINSNAGIKQNYVLGMAAGARELLPLLDSCEKKGIIHFAFNEGPGKARFQSISEIRAKISEAKERKRRENENN